MFYFSETAESGEAAAAAAAPEGAASTEGATASASPLSSSPEIKPMERQVEARSLDDSMASIVRFLYFADTFAVSGKCKPNLFNLVWHKAK